MMQETARNLEKAGADFILIACNSAHYWYDEIKESVNIPVLNIIEETARYIKESSPNIKKVGLLAGLVPVKANLYKKTFERFNIEVIHPENKNQKIVVKSIETIKLGKKEDQIRQDLLRVSDKLVEKGAEGIILACTEFPIVFKDYTYKVPIFDSDLILAKAAVNLARE